MPRKINKMVSLDTIINTLQQHRHQLIVYIGSQSNPWFVEWYTGHLPLMIFYVYDPKDINVKRWHINLKKYYKHRNISFKKVLIDGCGWSSSIGLPRISAFHFPINLPVFDRKSISSQWELLEASSKLKSVDSQLFDFIFRTPSGDEKVVIKTPVQPNFETPPILYALYDIATANLGPLYLINGFTFTARKPIFDCAYLTINDNSLFSMIPYFVPFILELREILGTQFQIIGDYQDFKDNTDKIIRRINALTLYG